MTDRRPLRCWWFGCEPHPEDPAPPEYLTCVWCNQVIDYGDLVGDTRHKRFTDWCYWWLFRRWIPAKCVDCGRRYGCHDDCDDIPF